MTVKVECKMRFGRGRKRRNSVEHRAQRLSVPRIAKLMALAIRFDQLIKEGIVKDQADLARLGQVSRARVTQIMNLLNLAPELQEHLIFALKGGISERQLRSTMAIPCWCQQRARFARWHTNMLAPEVQVLERGDASRVRRSPCS
jgi:hypothetical protein